MNLRLPALLLGAAVVLAPAALAMPQFRLIAIPQLHYDKDYPLWELDKRAMSCTFCHVNESGGAPWNPFGQALKAQFVADAVQATKTGQRNKFGQVLYDLLKSGQDSDGDGYPDALEVYAHTLPGDPSSKPTQSVADLQAAFDAAGGVDMYAPVKAKN